MNRPRATATSNYGWDSLGHAARRATGDAVRGCGGGGGDDSTGLPQTAERERRSVDSRLLASVAVLQERWGL